jgi:hypothetical protein
MGVEKLQARYQTTGPTVLAPRLRASTGAVTFSWLPYLMAHATWVKIWPSQLDIIRIPRLFAALCILKRIKQEQGWEIHGLGEWSLRDDHLFP